MINTNLVEPALPVYRPGDKGRLRWDGARGCPLYASGHEATIVRVNRTTLVVTIPIMIGELKVNKRQFILYEE